MNGTHKRWVCIGIALASLMHLIPVEARAEKKIGILLFSEEARYVDSQKGLLDQLTQEGFGEPAVKFFIENANGSKAKAAEVVRKFAAARMDLILTIGTSATIAATREIKDVPVVFTMVFDPVQAGIAQSWKSSGNNTTGASPNVPMLRIMQVLKAFGPMKRLLVPYTPGEKNSELQVTELQRLQAEYQVKVIPIILNNKEDVEQVLSGVVQSVDAIVLTGSSVVGATVPRIVALANKSNVVTITHLDDLVEKGALLGVCANSYRLARMAGKQAVRVLKGAKPASIPIVTEKNPDVILNRKTARGGQFTLSPTFMESVTKVIE
jgi:putative ABC transport system substrate-binding protein